MKLNAKLRLIASSNVKTVKDWLAALGMRVQSLVRDDHQGVVVRVDKLSEPKALSILNKVASANGVRVESRQSGSGDYMTHTVTLDGGALRLSMSPDWTYSTVAVDIAPRKMQSKQFPKWHGRSPAIDFSKLWTKGERPVLTAWPEYCYHCTTQTSAQNMVKNGNQGSLLYFAFSADLAFAYGDRFGSDVVLLEVPVAKLNPRRIMFDVNTAGESFSYEGPLSSSAFKAYQK